MTNNDVINRLKQAGFRIRVQHFRYYHLNRAGELTKKRHLLPTQAPRAKLGRSLDLMDANGGMTRCLVLQSVGASNVGRFAEGEARCATDDTFNRSQGVRFALRDALLNLEKGGSEIGGSHHTLLIRRIEQLEQVENEYQENLRLQGEAQLVRQSKNLAIWGGLRAASEKMKDMPRDYRLRELAPHREKIEREALATEEPITA